MNKEEIRDLFEIADKDSKGYITMEEITSLIGERMSRKTWEKWFFRMDKNAKLTMEGKK